MTYKVTLKAIKILEKASEETICFEANVFINGTFAGHASNDGRGGETWVRPDQCKRNLCKDADDYFRSLPPKKYGEIEFPQSLEGEIDDIINDHYNAKQKEKAIKKLTRMTANHLVFVNENITQRLSIKFSLPIQTLIDHGHLARLQGSIQRTLQKHPGFKLFNTNIPSHQ